MRRLPYDFKVDIWALGCLLYYLTCLHPPFIVQKDEDHIAKLDKMRSKRKSIQSLFKINNNPAGSKTPFLAGRGGSSLTRRQVLEEMILHE